ncbi:MAG: 60S ribosomal subunit assembly/export protein [Phylliscum demangeonii]|nr:MAG: 60S ribosomal subunit assembly/export protein [Phylliscum demangeonii]
MAPSNNKRPKTASKGSRISKNPTRTRPGTKPGTSARTSSTKPKSRPKGPPPKQPKAKPTIAPPPKKRKRVYTAKELGIPTLNMITPAGVQKPKGKKKGKTFVDDAESMMTILAMVTADKEGQIESKIMKARQMEEIREARSKEQNAKQEVKKRKLEEAKDLVRRKRKPKKNDVDLAADNEVSATTRVKPKKRVSFK